MKKKDNSVRLHFLEKSISVLCFICCILLVLTYYSSVYIMQKKHEVQKMSLFGRFTSMHEVMGFVRVDKSDKGLKFDIQFKGLSDDF